LIYDFISNVRSTFASCQRRAHYAHTRHTVIYLYKGSSLDYTGTSCL